MDKKDLYYNDPTPNIDSRTGFVKGSQEYNDYYFPKKEKSDLYLVNLYLVISLIH